MTEAVALVAQTDVHYVDLDTLVPHPANPRRGNIEAIMQSIKTNGWHGVIVAQVSTRRILVGKHRWEAAKRLGMTRGPVQWRDVDDAEALRIVIADNRASDLATYDKPALVSALEAAEGHQGTLFTLDDMETLRAEAGAAAPVEAPEFSGDYADAGAEREERKKAAERTSEAMKDVLLVMKPEDYKQFLEDVKALQKRWSTTTVAAVAIAAIHQCATEQGDVENWEERFKKAQEWAARVKWAVPHDEQVAFGEVFGV